MNNVGHILMVDDIINQCCFVFQVFQTIVNVHWGASDGPLFVPFHRSSWKKSSRCKHTWKFRLVARLCHGRLHRFKRSIIHYLISYI